MDSNTFKGQCEGIIVVDELPPLSRLRQKVAGCYDIFGMCPEGEIVALDAMGNVNCLKAEVRDGASWCEENGDRCGLEARPSDILGVIRLLRDFEVTNFVTKEGRLPETGVRKISEGNAAPCEDDSTLVVTEAEYADEDLGVSRYLTDDEKTKRRPGDPDEGGH